jgi:hypothetical protein
MDSYLVASIIGSNLGITLCSFNHPKFNLQLYCLEGDYGSSGEALGSSLERVVVKL